MNTTTNLKTFVVTADFSSTTYRVVDEFFEQIATIAIPHRHKAKAHIYKDKSNLIHWAHVESSLSSSWSFSEFSLAELDECFGDDVPKNALEIATRDGCVVGINDDWVAKSDSDEYAWAVEFFGHDEAVFYTFESVGEAVEWMTSYSGHGSGTAGAALAESLCKNGFLEKVESDKR